MYAELAVTTNYTFLRGAAHPEEYVRRAAELGHAGIAITDTHTLGGIIRAHTEAARMGLPLAIGSRVVFRSDHHRLAALLYPTCRASYARLCRLLTLGKRRSAKGQCTLYLHDLLADHAGLLVVAQPPREITDDALCMLTHLAGALGPRLSIAARYHYNNTAADRLRQISRLADHLRCDMVACNDVIYHCPSRRPLADVLTCINHHCTVDTAGFLLNANSERHLKPAEDMRRLFAEYPQAIDNALAIFQQASAFSLNELRYQYPQETCPPNVSPIAHLRSLAVAGANDRYPNGMPAPVRDRIEHELRLIDELKFPHYFLTVHDIVRFARSRGILCQGRGAAANSAVCFCLGLTSVDPDRINLLFERFISRARHEPPDIDIDFEHERREEVLQYIYQKYGRDRAALTAEVITYRSRSALREVGKALGLSLDAVDRLAKNTEWFDPHAPNSDKLRELGFDPTDRTMRQLVALARAIRKFPRHRSQHVGGFVLTHEPLCNTVPIENAAMADRTIIEWDKDDIDAIGILKVDCLGLGMLTCLQKSWRLISQWEHKPNAAHATLDMSQLPPEDPAVYDMICKADTVGVFQIESRAQMSMLPRLRPRCFYDLVIEVAIVRPGPIVGDMVHPYLRRRNGRESPWYPDAMVERVLGRTLGVTLFQEQAMALAIECAGFTADDADHLRRAVTGFRRFGDIDDLGRQFVDGMTSHGYSLDFAGLCFQQMKGFSEYGFPESHAASFALIVYASAYLKHHYPAAFAAGLINAQPMGFYAPAQIIQDAKHHGVTVLPIDVNHSQWDCALEPERDMGTNRQRDEVGNGNAVGEGDGVCPTASAVADMQPRATESPAIRLGMRLVKGLRREDADRVAQAVAEHGPVRSIQQLRRLSGTTVGALRALARGDAFASLGLTRQQALWQVRQLHDDVLPLFDQINEPDQAERSLPKISLARQVTADYHTTGLSLKRHPMALLRDTLSQEHVSTADQLTDQSRWSHGQAITVAGLVLVRQRPGTANGVVFMTLEDETGVVNLIFWPKVYERLRKVARHAVILKAHGTVQRDDDAGQVVHVLVKQAWDIGRREAQPVPDGSRNFH